MRLVVVGTPASSVTVTQATIMASGPDLRSSHFEWAVLDGLDLRNLDLRDVSLIDSKVTKCNLTGAQSNYLYSRRTRYTGTVLPTDIQSFNQHDMIMELVRRALVNKIGQRKQALSLVLQHGRTYSSSWKDSIWKLVNELGLTVPQIEAFFAAVFSNYPKLIERFRRELEKGEFRPPPLLTGEAEADAPRLPYDAVVNRNDRYELARRVEADLRETSLLKEVRAYVSQLEPVPVLALMTVAPTGWDWWGSSNA